MSSLLRASISASKASCSAVLVVSAVADFVIAFFSAMMIACFSSGVLAAARAALKAAISAIRALLRASLRETPCFFAFTIVCFCFSIIAFCCSGVLAVERAASSVFISDSNFACSLVLVAVFSAAGPTIACFSERITAYFA